MSYEIRNLRAPPRPVVSDIVSPQIHVVRNAFGAQHAPKLLGAAQTALFVRPLSAHKADEHILAHLVEHRSTHVRDEFHWIVEVHPIIVMAVEQESNVVD